MGNVRIRDVVARFRVPKPDPVIEKTVKTRFLSCRSVTEVGRPDHHRETIIWEDEGYGVEVVVVLSEKDSL